MTVYILDNPTLPAYGLWRFEGPLTNRKARRLVSDGCISAITHEPTARLLSKLLGTPVTATNQRVIPAPGDKAVVLRLLAQLPEDAASDDLAQPHAFPHELALLKRLE